MQTKLEALNGVLIFTTQIRVVVERHFNKVQDATSYLEDLQPDPDIRSGLMSEIRARGLNEKPEELAEKIIANFKGDGGASTRVLRGAVDGTEFAMNAAIMGAETDAEAVQAFWAGRKQAVNRLASIGVDASKIQPVPE